MTGTQLTAVLVAILGLFLVVGWMLLRGFLGELRATRDVVSRGQEIWDSAATLSSQLDRAMERVDERIKRLEGHDFHRLNNELQMMAGRLARVEDDVKGMSVRLEDVQAMTVETNAIAKELRNR
jgi:hypothetical protein